MQNYEYLRKLLQICRLAIKNRFCMAPIGGGQHHLPVGAAFSLLLFCIINLKLKKGSQ